MVELVKLFGDTPPLNDVPARLEHLAKQIRDGEHGAVATCFVVLPVDDEYPSVFGFGDISGKNDPAIQLELAKYWLLQNLVARR